MINHLFGYYSNYHIDNIIYSMNILVYSISNTKLQQTTLFFKLIQ